MPPPEAAPANDAPARESQAPTPHPSGELPRTALHVGADWSPPRGAEADRLSSLSAAPRAASAPEWVATNEMTACSTVAVVLQAAATVTPEAAGICPWSSSCASLRHCALPSLDFHQ